jgi:DNA-binding SARP family transcriptional activator/tetratricopeptide (TPR) repeat protein
MLGELTLLRPDGTEDPLLVARGRKLVLLSYLALSRRPIARDRLATFLWGHRDDERARHSLRDALSVLRQSLGAMIPRGREVIALPADAPLDVDVIELRAAAKAGDHSAVVELYRGPFLEGVHLTDASEVEDWIAEERLSTERLFLAACAAECPRLADASDWDSCAIVSQRWLAADPTDSAAFVWRLRALAAPDSPTALRGAISEYQRHTALLAREFDASPPKAAQELCAELSDRLARTHEPADVELKVVNSASTDSRPISAPAPPARGQPRQRMLRAAWPTIAIAGGVFLALAITAFLVRADRGPPVPGSADLVVAGIESPSRGGDDVWLEAGLPRLLTSSLIREGVPGVIDPSRVRAVSRTAGLANTNGSVDASAAMDVARRIRATTLVSGEVTRGAGRFLLDLSIRDVASGAVRHRISVSDTSLFGLVDQATARLLAAVDRTGPGFRFEDLETSSVDSYRAYILALDRIDAGRAADAAQLLDAAISADSAFAAALRKRLDLLGSRTPQAKDSVRRLTAALSRARRLESDFDRRMAELTKAAESGDGAHATIIARDLVTRYPRDVRAYRSLILSLLDLGRFAEAEEVATRALALDSATRRAGTSPCATCALYGAIVTTALATGDARTARAAARRDVSIRPSEPAPWYVLARALVSSDSIAEAIAAAEQATRLAPREQSWAEAHAWLLIETGHLDAADSLLRVWNAGGQFALAALDVKGAVLRERGRYAAAVNTYERALARGKDFADSAALRLVLASSSAYSGDVAAATRTFEQAALHPGMTTGRSQAVFSPSVEARSFAWPHALLADALFLSGSRDTLRLLALADSIESIGGRSIFGRDGRLHFHVRGLVAEIGGRWTEAEHSFERARWGRGGWTRTNVELARTQVAQSRPLDAVATLRDAGFGTLDGMGRYAPRTEINAAIAEAFLSAHLPDSARVYLARVRSAWANADARQRRRLADIERAVEVGAPVADIDHPQPKRLPLLPRR